MGSEHANSVLSLDRIDFSQPERVRPDVRAPHSYRGQRVSGAFCSLATDGNLIGHMLRLQRIEDPLLDRLWKPEKMESTPDADPVIVNVTSGLRDALVLSPP